jgi:hypothetical protein
MIPVIFESWPTKAQKYIDMGKALQSPVTQFMRPGHQATRRIEAFPKPIIAAVNVRFSVMAARVNKRWSATARKAFQEIRIQGHHNLRLHISNQLNSIP